MAPRYEPGRTFEILKGFLSDEFFKVPHEVNLMTAEYLLQLNVKGDATEMERMGGYVFLEHAMRRLFAVDVPQTLMGHAGVEAWNIKVTLMPDDFVWDGDDDAGVDSSTRVSVSDRKRVWRRVGQLEDEAEIEEVAVGGDGFEVGRALTRKLGSKSTMKQFVIDVTVEIVDAEHGLSLKQSMDTAFMMSLQTGLLRAYIHRAFYSQVSLTSTSTLVIPFSYTGLVKLRGGMFSTYYGMDIGDREARPGFDEAAYFNISWHDADWDDDYVNPKTSESKVPWYHWVLDPVDIVIIVFVPTGIIFIVLLVFVTYRKYHDKLIGDWGYEIHTAEDEWLGADGQSRTDSGEVQMSATRNPLSSY